MAQAGTLAFAVIGAAALRRVPPPPANAIYQPLSDGVAANIKASRTALANWRAIFDEPPDPRYDGFAALPMAHKPNVYLLMIEAYGELLATCQPNTAYRDLLGRVGERLTKSGYHARSGYSVSPIDGGRSWMAMASVQTGIRIDSQPAYRVLEKEVAHVPTLTNFFKAHGYHTMMLQPLDAHRVGVTDDDVYQRVAGSSAPTSRSRARRTGLPGFPTSTASAISRTTSWPARRSRGSCSTWPSRPTIRGGCRRRTCATGRRSTARCSRGTRRPGPRSTG